MSHRVHTYAYFFAALTVLSVVALRVYAAEISNVTVTEVTENTATVEWTTDVNTDATINYGLDPAVGVVRDPAFDKKDHTLTIENLDPSTTYHFRVMSSDQSGNTNAAAGYVFTTKGNKTTDATKEVKDQEEKGLTERIISDLSKVTDPKAILAIADKVKQVAGDIIKPPAIVGAPKVTVEENRAIITWTTDRESGSVVHLVPESEYNAASSDPYTIHQGDATEAVTRHRVEVIGLEPSTVYHFKVTSIDDLGLTGETEDDTFKTKSILPQIGNIQVTRIQDHSAVVNWTTGGVLAKGVVEFTNQRTGATRSAGNPVFVANHSVLLADLEFGTRYSVVISATNEGGEEVKSQPFTFVTVRDVIAPTIAKVKNESTLFPGEETKIQTIMSWETDEPATCQVFYTQGLVIGEGDVGDAMPPELNPLTAHTQVVVGFAPATVYKFWMKCSDEALNESRSEDFVLITPVKEKNIIDIILENFEGTFGWVNNIGG